MKIQAYYLLDGYGRKSRGRGLDGWYRDLTVREAKEFPTRQLYATDFRGMVRQIRLCGKPKTWKTRPGCILNLIYGLKDYFHVGEDHLGNDDPISDHLKLKIIVPVAFGFPQDTPPDIVADYVIEHELYQDS